MGRYEAFEDVLYNGEDWRPKTGHELTEYPDHQGLLPYFNGKIEKLSGNIIPSSESPNTSLKENYTKSSVATFID